MRESKAVCEKLGDVTFRPLIGKIRDLMKHSKRKLSVAPMMDWTDRHCRVFHRQITRHTWLYTEMVNTGALVYGDAERHLRFDDIEHPIALQLGGSDPGDLEREREAW